MSFWSKIFKGGTSSGSVSSKRNKDGRIKTDRYTNTGNKTSGGKPKHEHSSVKVNPKTGFNQQHWGGENSHERSYNSSSSNETSYQPGDENPTGTADY